MITNNYVSLREWFYPIGNTPAVNILRDVCLNLTLTKPKQDLELLLLACGDPRNILFSIFCCEGPRELAFLYKAIVRLKNDFIVNNYTFRFTCCDHEPAILGTRAEDTLLTFLQPTADIGFYSS